MKRLEEITRYAMDDYAKYWLSEWIYYCQWIIAIKGMLSGYYPFYSLTESADSRIFTRRRRDGKRVYPCKLRYAWVKNLVNWMATSIITCCCWLIGSIQKHHAEYGEFSATSRIAGGMVARAWAVALRRTGDMANKSPFIYQASLMNLIAEMAQIGLFPQLHIPHQLSGEGVHQNHNDGERNFGCSQG